MAHPHVGFKAVCDGRVVWDLPAGQGPRDRMLALLGKELSTEVLEASADQYDDARGVTLYGLVGKPSLARPTNKSQHVFVNGRPVRDRTIMHAIAEAFRGLIEPGKHATAAIMLEMAPSLVDVNVHPQKSEVRFRDSSLIHSIVLHSIRRALREADLTPLFNLARPVFADEARAIIPTAGMGSGAGETGSLTPQVRENAAEQFVSFFKRTLPSRGQEPFSYESMKQTMASAPAAISTQSAAPASEMEAQLVEPPVPQKQILQVHKSFLVTQESSFSR
jgi:DNA mismatch repair protein MutL